MRFDAHVRRPELAQPGLGLSGTGTGAGTGASTGADTDTGTGIGKDVATCKRGRAVAGCLAQAAGLAGHTWAMP